MIVAATASAASGRPLTFDASNWLKLVDAADNNKVSLPQ